MDSYKSMVLTLTTTTAIAVGGAFVLTSANNPGEPQPASHGQQQRHQATPVSAPPLLDCARFRGALAEDECNALNRHYGLPPRERGIYNGATRILQGRQEPGGAPPAPSPQVAYALARQMGLPQQDAPLVYQAMQDNYKRHILAKKPEQMVSDLREFPAR